LPQPLDLPLASLPLPLLRSAGLKQHVEHVVESWTVDTTQAARCPGAEKLDGIGGPAEAENSIAIYPYKSMVPTIRRAYS